MKKGQRADIIPTYPPLFQQVLFFFVRNLQTRIELLDFSECIQFQRDSDTAFVYSTPLQHPFTWLLNVHTEKIKTFADDFLFKESADVTLIIGIKDRNDKNSGDWNR